MKITESLKCDPVTMPLRYGFADIIIPNPEDRPAYCKFVIVDADNDVIEFYTNRAGEGLFFHDKETGTYKQALGTMQFAIKGTHQNTIRHRMREVYVMLKNYDFACNTHYKYACEDCAWPH